MAEFNAQLGNILFPDLFCFQVVKPVIPILPLLPNLCVCEKLYYATVTVATYLQQPPKEK